MKHLILFALIIINRNVFCQIDSIHYRDGLYTKGDSLYTGWIDENDNKYKNNVKRKSYIRNGIPDSLIYDYYSNGIIFKKTEINAARSKKNVTEFYENSNIKKTTLFYKDTICKEIGYYNDKYHSVSYEAQYKHGLLYGTYNCYFAFTSFKQQYQNLYYTAEYIDGKLNGENVFYYKNGSKKEVRYYKNNFNYKTIFYNKRGKYSGCLGCME